MILPILKIPSKGLYQKSQEISRIDDKIIQLSKDVLETKRANFGVGLAAPQVGKLMRIIVLGNLEHQEKKELKIPEQILINPFIVKKSSETEIADEGCLSLPGLTGKVSRHKEINIKATSLEIIGNKTQTKKIQFKAKNFQARVIQHEIDHLDGILFSDKVEDVKTIKRIPTPYKIVFLGTPEFAVPVLESLIKNNWSISLVITEPDKPVGRKQILTPPPIKKIASKYKLLVYQPEKLSSIKSSLKNLQPDVIILAAYGKILPKEIVDAPLYGSLCLHPSLLPKYRGPSPIQEMILSDEKQIGATLFKMDEKVDHGPIIANMVLEKNISKYNYEQLSKNLSKLSAKLLLDNLALYLNGKIKPKNQNHKAATSTKLIKKEDGYIPISKIKHQKSKRILQEIEGKIRAFYPWPKVWTVVNKKRVIIHKAHLSIINHQLSIILDIIQPEGKKPMSYEEYLKGNPKII